MSVYNAEKYLRDAIESILNQTFIDFEFLIINDCSTDNSKNIILSYKDIRIKYIENEKNIGLTKSLNKGIDLAKGEFIARMDADDISMPQRFERQINFFTQNPEFALCGTSLIVMNEQNEQISTWNYENNNLKERLFFGNYFAHSSIMAKTIVFKEFMYNENLYAAQDYFLWSQIALKYQVTNLSELLIKYRVHNESISVSKFNMQEDSVKQTFAFHLQQIGLKKLTEPQKEFHYQILRNKTEMDYQNRQSINILKWIDFLWKQNKKYQIYDNNFFYKKLSEYWNKYFSVNYSFKFAYKTIPLIFSDFVKTNKREKLMYILKSLKNTNYIGIPFKFVNNIKNSILYFAKKL